MSVESAEKALISARAEYEAAAATKKVADASAEEAARICRVKERAYRKAVVALAVAKHNPST